MLSVRIVPFVLPLNAPLTTANGTVDERAGVLVGVTDEHGMCGWGEATPMPGWSAEDTAMTEAALIRWRDGQRSVRSTTSGRGERPAEVLLDELGGFPHALAAASGALDDLAARQAGQPLAEHLRPGARSTRPVAVSALVGGTGPDQLVASTLAAVASGCSTVKIKVAAQDPRADIERVTAARTAVGPDIRIRLDANGGWDHDTAVATLRALERFDIEMCEEPVAGLAGLAAVRNEVGVPIAIDETLDSAATLEAAIAAGAADIVICKPQALGGPRLALDIVDRATEAGLAVVVTSFIDGTIGVVTALHVAALLPPGGPAHGLATSSLLAADNAPPPPVVGGMLSAPSGPGLGVDPYPRFSKSDRTTS